MHHEQMMEDNDQEVEVDDDDDATNEGAYREGGNTDEDYG